jgi:hypothetical protein
VAGGGGERAEKAKGTQIPSVPRNLRLLYPKELFVLFEEMRGKSIP